SNIVFKEKDLLNLNEKVKYDLVYSIDVLEHIPGNKKVIENIFGALKKGGIFYLAMPWDEANSRLLPAFFFKDSDAWADKEHIGEQYSLNELTDLMKKIGFKILEARYTFGIWGKLAWEMEKVFTFLGPTGSIFKPFLKMLGHLDIYKRNKEGALLVIAKR
ncbi:MAG: methyltransferase domain-containing protein, partial [Thermodesulfobacteriota bacterium]